jgi:flagellar motor switch/type III secretory pathway protein FliN
VFAGPIFYFLSNPSRRSPGCAEAIPSSKSLSLLLLTHCGWKTLAAAQQPLRGLRIAPPNSKFNAARNPEQLRPIEMDAAVQRAKEPQSVANPTSAKDPSEIYGWFPCLLSLEIPVSRFTVGDLLRLRVGSIVGTSSHHASDIPLRANGLLIGWTEFEVIGSRVAVRITELA